MSVITVADAVTIADAYIEQTLLADPTINLHAPGGVWNEVAEQGTTGRIIRYVFLRGASARQAGYFGIGATLNNELVFEVLTYLVTMVGEDDRFEDLRVGAGRLKELLHRTEGTSINEASITLGTVLWSRYLAPHKERVPVDDKWFPELGSVFEIAVQPPVV